MGLDQDRQELETHLRELRQQVASAGTSVSPDTRLAVHAALVQSEAALLLADVLQSATQTLVHDALQPLMARLPDR